MNPRNVQVGKFYRITLSDTTLVYQVYVTKVVKDAIKATYVPFSRFELTGRFPFKDIMKIEEI